MKNENWNWRRPAYREFEFDNTSIDSSDKKLVFEISKTTGWQICADKEPLEVRIHNAVHPSKIWSTLVYAFEVS